MGDEEAVTATTQRKLQRLQRSSRTPCVPGQLRQWIIEDRQSPVLVVRVISTSPVESMVEYLWDGELQSDFAVWMELHTDPVP